MSQPTQSDAVVASQNSSTNTLNFAQLHLHQHLLNALDAAKFTIPTPVQTQAIPPALAGKDIMACADTGTGKTGAFTLPILDALLKHPRDKKGPDATKPRALILTPTRELADQVSKTVKQFMDGSGLKVGILLGGVPYAGQMNMLQRPLDILIATPGRLMDHMAEGRVDLSAIEMFVLDEADRMLDMGFAKPVEKISAAMPEARQTFLFSATFNPQIEKLAKVYLEKPVQIRLASGTKPNTNIAQQVYFTQGKDHKFDLLKAHVQDETLWQAIVFMKTKFATERVAKSIQAWGIPAAALHGDMKQNARKRVVKEMHANNIRVLVATDVAARGLDIKDLSHVINFDLPQVPEDYIHRIGRTGRAGATGIAISYVGADDYYHMVQIEKLVGQELEAQNERPNMAGASAPKRGGKGGRSGSRAGGTGPRTGARTGAKTRSDAPRGDRKPFAGTRKTKSDRFGDRSSERSGERFADRADRGSYDNKERGNRQDKPFGKSFGNKGRNSDTETRADATRKPSGSRGKPQGKPFAKRADGTRTERTWSDKKRSDGKRNDAPRKSFGKPFAQGRGKAPAQRQPRQA